MYPTSSEGTTETWIDRVVWGDALEIMPQLPAGVADTIFWDPPYYLQLPDVGKKRLRRWNVNTEVDGVHDEWDKFSSFQDYDLFVEKCLHLMRKVMKDNGTIWVIGTYHNIHRIGKIMQDMGFWILNDVIWVKTNPMPNWLGVRFTNAIETLIWAVKDKEVKGYYFDRVRAKEYSGSSIAPSVWRLPICTGSERIKTAEGKKLHSTQKPEALLERIIAISTPLGGLIFDPMAGTGTTAVVAKRLGRHFLVIEKEKRYVEAIEARLRNIQGVISI